MAAKASSRSRHTAPASPREDGGHGQSGADRRQVTVEERRIFQHSLQESARELAAIREVVDSERRRYRELFEFAPDGYLVTREDGTIREANRAAAEMLGIAPEFLIGKPLLFFVAREHRMAFLSELRKVLQSEAARLMETVLLRRGRGPLAAEMRVGPVRGGVDRRLVGFRWLIRDVTGRREAEEAARVSGEQLRALWARLESVREEEQTRIARELHDEFGQAITALKFELKPMGAVAAQTPEGARCLDRISGQLDQMLTSIRRISRELRPSLLDDLGLEAAAEWHTREFAARTGIECRLVSTLGLAAVDRAVATAAYRILQEALTNVARHSGARRVEVCLAAEGDRLTLTILDDGRGIPADRIDDGAGLGLAGMRERARLVQGSVSIERPGPGGTCVSLSAPRTLAP